MTVADLLELNKISREPYLYAGDVFSSCAAPWRHMQLRPQIRCAARKYALFVAGADTISNFVQESLYWHVDCYLVVGR
jgi:hypothetical protein